MSTFFGVAVSVILFLTGMWMFGAAYNAHGFEALVFVGGILVIALSIFIPTSIITRARKTSQN